jgi:Icc-related predicted phosphoesterase
MIVDVISDLHGFYPKLEGVDLLIVAGDLTARDEIKEYMAFHEWVRKQEYKKVILIAGNHDNKIQDGFFNLDIKRNVTKEWLGFEYLCDSGTEFEGLKIWGSPWTKTFPGMNPHCKAFTCDTEEELAIKFSLIPEDTDILITHGPPRGILDCNKYGFNCGSTSLFEKSRKLKNLKLFCFGHIHEAYSMINTQEMNNSLLMLLSPNKPNCLPVIVNASHVNEIYEPVNKPIRIIL